MLSIKPFKAWVMEVQIDEAYNSERHIVVLCMPITNKLFDYTAERWVPMEQTWGPVHNIRLPKDIKEKLLLSMF